jgi:hypothetical protein
MTDSRAALGSDRLPWLADEPAAVKSAPRTPALPNLWGLAAAALLLVVAAGFYWLGTRSSIEQQSANPQTGRTVVAPLPQARTVPPEQQVEINPQPEVSPPLAPEVRSSPQRELRIEKPRPVRRIVQNPEAPQAGTPDQDASAASAATGQSAAPPAAKPAAPVAERPLRAWPATQSAGAAGRIVRVGAFGTRLQAKLGWRYMVRSYPAVAHLRATVVEDRNSRGRHFYRFQIGTTSQAHSEVLCQRMERIRLSCAVVGLPWKPKGVER